MQLLLSSGASVEARDVTGKTALLVAAYSGQCNAIGECCPHFNSEKLSYPCNMRCRPVGLRDVKDPTLSRQSAHRWQ
jgi:hypothetical protein